jgi:hypothetical protein
VAGGWRRLQNEELHNLYASPNSQVITSWKMGGACRMHRHKWDDSNTRMDLREIGRDGVDWMHLAQDMEIWTNDGPL